MKRPRKDDLPPFDAERIFSFVEDPEEHGPFPARTEIAHHRETAFKLNGPPANFLAAMARLNATANAPEIARAVFDAHREAALDAAARHPEAPHRAAARTQLKAEVKAMEAARAGLQAARDTQAGDYSPSQMVGLVGRRGGSGPAQQGPELVALIEGIEILLGNARSSVEALDGRGEARTTRLRLFAERLAPIYTETIGRPIKSKSSAYDDAGELTGFALFIASACDLVAGVVPSATLVANIAKDLVGK